MRKIRKLYVQKVLPLVYDYSLSVSEMVGKLIRAVNDVADDVETNTDDIENLETTVTSLSDQTDLNTRSIGTISGKIEDIEHELDNVPTDARIEELQEGINDNASDIADLDGRVDILESQPDLSSIVAINTSNISTLQGDVSDLDTAVQGKSTVTYTRDLGSGTKIGSISIDNVSTDIYAPSPTVIPDASGIVYDNTQSGMQASNVQTAIDELDTDISNKSTVSVTQVITTGSKVGTITVDGVGTDLYAPSATVIPGADGITYDNQNSGLQATNVQDAIDEVDTAVTSKSSVSVSQITTKGDDIATVTVDGVSTTIYSGGVTNEYSARIESGSRYYYALPNGVFSGVLTGSAKDIYFYVPMPYDYSLLPFNNLWRLDCAGTYIRGISGNLVSNVNLSTYTNSSSDSTATQRFTLTFQNGGILFLLHNDNGFGGTTNTPVSVYFGSNAKIWDRPSS